MVIVFLLAVGIRPTAGADSLIPDKALDSLLREILKRKGIEKEQIEADDLQKVHFLDARKRGIESLAGLELCTGLRTARLSRNRITDVSALAACIELQSLNLASNQIVDVTPLRSLQKLQYLNIEGNAVEQIECVADMKQLRSLYAGNNVLTEIGPLKGSPELHSVYLANNQIGDISALGLVPKLSSIDLRRNVVEDVSVLSKLRQLRWTFLSGNRIADISVLAEMAMAAAAGPQNFAPYWRLYLEENPLNDAAREHLRQLSEAGVRVTVRTAEPLHAPEAAGKPEPQP